MKLLGLSYLAETQDPTPVYRETLPEDSGQHNEKFNDKGVPEDSGQHNEK